MISEDTQDQAALYALGLLDEDEAATFERALAADEELRALATELSEAATSLARTDTGNAAPSPVVRLRVLAAVANGKRGHPETGKVIAGPRSWTRWMPWAAAAVLAICCGVLAILCWKLADADIGNGFHLIAVERRAQTAEAELAKERVRSNGAETLRRVSYCPLDRAETASSTGPQAGVLWDAAQRRGRLQVQKLPSAGNGKDYQLWAVEAGHKNPVSAGVVKVDADGGAELDFQPGPGDDPQAAVTAFALSLERAGGVPQGEGPILFIGKLPP